MDDVKVKMNSKGVVATMKSKEMKNALWSIARKKYGSGMTIYPFIGWDRVHIVVKEKNQ